MKYAKLRRLVIRLHFPFLVKVSVDFHVLISFLLYLTPYFRSFQFEQLVAYNLTSRSVGVNSDSAVVNSDSVGVNLNL
jgi:hypothetical protein